MIITVTRQAGPNAVINGLFFDPPSTAISGKRRPFDAKDTTTQGNWENVYGTQGYDLVNDAVSIPSYATVIPAGRQPTPGPPRRPTLAPSRPPAAATASPLSGIPPPASRSTSISTTDKRTTSASMRWTGDNRGRSEQIQISSATTGAILDTETVSNFSSGVYLQWNVTGQRDHHGHRSGRQQPQSSTGCSSTRPR